MIFLEVLKADTDPFGLLTLPQVSNTLAISKALLLIWRGKKETQIFKSPPKQLLLCILFSPFLSLNRSFYVIDTFRTADSAKPGINDEKRLFKKIWCWTTLHPCIRWNLNKIVIHPPPPQLKKKTKNLHLYLNSVSLITAVGDAWGWNEISSHYQSFNSVVLLISTKLAFQS